MSYAIRIQDGKVAEPPTLIPPGHSFSELFHEELHHGVEPDPSNGFLETDEEGIREGMLYKDGKFIDPLPVELNPPDPRLVGRQEYLQKIKEATGINTTDMIDFSIGLFELLLADDDTLTDLRKKMKSTS